MLQDETIMADLKAKRNIIVAEREKYQDFLREMKVDFIPSQSNFIMIPGDSWNCSLNSGSISSSFVRLTTLLECASP